jgi:hypothetical protein
MTDDSDEIALATRLHPQNAEAIVFVMKCHSFDEPGENFCWIVVYRHRWLLAGCRMSKNHRQKAKAAGVNPQCPIS